MGLDKLPKKSAFVILLLFLIVSLVLTFINDQIFYTLSPNINAQESLPESLPQENEDEIVYSDPWSYECYNLDENSNEIISSDSDLSVPTDDEDGEGPGSPPAFEAAAEDRNCEHPDFVNPGEVTVGCLAWAVEACGANGVKSYCGVNLENPPGNLSENELSDGLCPEFDRRNYTPPDESELRKDLRAKDIIYITREDRLDDENADSDLPVPYSAPIRGTTYDYRTQGINVGLDELSCPVIDTEIDDASSFQIRELRDGEFSHYQPEIRCQNATDIYSTANGEIARSSYDSEQKVTASASGVIVDIQTPDIISRAHTCVGDIYDGGIILKLQDEFGNIHLYVHLDEDIFENIEGIGSSVEAGDILGSVFDGEFQNDVEYQSYNQAGERITVRKDLSDYAKIDVPTDSTEKSCYEFEHLHYAIISANAINDDSTTGNLINSNRIIGERCDNINFPFPSSRWGLPILPPEQLPDNCKRNQEPGELEGVFEGASLSQDIPSEALPNLSRNILAQANEDTEEPSSLNVENSGNYRMVVDGQVVTRTIILDEEVGSAEITFFRDLNGNNIQDSDEEIVAGNSIELDISPDQEQYEYEFNAGWNLINLPFVNEEITQASELMTILKDEGLPAVHLAKFENNQFILHTERADVTYTQEDFEIIPGEALFVFSTNGMPLFINGNPIEDPVPLQLNTGWNLVGVISDTEYTSRTFLNALSTEDIEANTISRFENGLYTSQVFEDQIYYGNEFNLTERRGYFLRITNLDTTEFTP